MLAIVPLLLYPDVDFQNNKRVREEKEEKKKHTHTQ